MSTVHLPRAFVSYRCQRSLVCQAPVRAPVHDDEVPRIRVALEASDDAGRLVADTLTERLELDPAVTREARIWRHREGRCINLDAPARACELHRSAGLGALPPGCRNFPRWVARLPDRIEVAFSLTCPTAARMLALDPEPFRLVVQDASDSPYAPTLVVPDEPRWDGEALTSAPLTQVLALREAWWQRLTEVRADPAGLVDTLSAMVTRPLEPFASIAAGLPPTPAPRDAQDALVALEREAARGASYRVERLRALAELGRPVDRPHLVAMVEPAPELVAAFASAGIQWIGVHDPRPVSEVVRLVARRALLVIRLVDAFCARLPFALGTLSADAFHAASFVAS